MKHPEDLNQFISELKKQQSLLLDQFEDLSSELQENQTLLQMAESVRENYYRHYRLPMPATQVDEGLRRKFAHLPIKEMLVLIATDADGLLDIADARKTLVRAGVFKDERNATTSIVPVLGRHDDSFRRIGRGLYVLTIKQQRGSDVAVQVDGPRSRTAEPRATITISVPPHRQRSSNGLTENKHLYLKFKPTEKEGE